MAVDLFAGGGGASEGIRRASGVSPVVAINHCQHAIDVHTLNHPETIHYPQSVYDVAPGDSVAGREVDLLWASPDCTHFSRAKGGKPRKKEIRALAGVVVQWAKAIAPTVLVVENVAEFRTWGPLDEDGYPIKARAGETFRAWISSLERLGYRVEHQVLAACDYGTPTTRKRLFVVARRDGLPIVWPEPTHGPGRPLAWLSAGSCIDWSIPCPSIFERKRELAEATKRRIAEGIRRFVLGSTEPYIVRLESTGPVVAGGVANTRNGERPGQTPRVRSVAQPLPTITAIGSQGAVIAAFLAKHNRGAVGQPLTEPMHTITSIDTKSVIAAHLTRCYGSPRTTGDGGGHIGAVAAFLVKYYGASAAGQRAGDPLHTIVSKARFGLVTVVVQGETYALVDIGFRMLQPRELATAQGFRPDYHLVGTKAQQTARIGNSVCPPVAQALVEAQFGGPGCPDLPPLADQVPLFGHRFEVVA